MEMIAKENFTNSEVRYRSNNQTQTLLNAAQKINATITVDTKAPSFP